MGINIEQLKREYYDGMCLRTITQLPEDGDNEVLVRPSQAGLRLTRPIFLSYSCIIRERGYAVTFAGWYDDKERSIIMSISWSEMYRKWSVVVDRPLDTSFIRNILGTDNYGLVYNPWILSKVAQHSRSYP